MPSRNAGTRASDAGKRGACCRGTQGARGDACWGTRDACCRSLGPCCKRGKGHALPHPHRRPRTRGLRSAQGKPVMADAGRGRACRRDARGACCGGGTRARAHAEKRACQRHKKVFSHAANISGWLRHVQAIREAAALAEAAGSGGWLWHPLLPTTGTACGHGFDVRRRWWAAARDRVEGWPRSVNGGHFEARAGRVAAAGEVRVG